jgi:probable rRNA maturation factor
MSVSRSVSIANHHPRLRIDRRAIRQVIRLLDAEFAPAGEKISPSPALRQCPPGELSIVFMTDPALARLHADFLDDPTVTDVITFEGDALLETAGEICVSADAARRQVALPINRALSARRREQFSIELTLYLVHGWLHLAGYDDLQPAKKRVMRRAEARAMRLLAQHERLPHFDLRT